MRLFLLYFIIASLMSCHKGQDLLVQSESKVKEKPMSISEKILHNAIEAHGGKKYDQAHYSFVFRDKNYTVKNNGKQFYYKVISNKDGVERVDVLKNETFTRTENGKPILLSDKDEKRFKNALNSVIYFATLPHKLQDPAVNKKYIGEQSIKNQSYEVIEITFNEEGGGDDHDDTFYYWINKSNSQIDYLAYNYTVNKGGVRFRTAYNKQVVDGILFQDYVNYKAEVGTALGDLPSLWESGELKELSKIETEKIKSL